jgi:hypothetical protein
VDVHHESGSQDYEEYLRKREEKKLKGEAKWWQF